MCPSDLSSTSSEDSYETAKSSQESTTEEQRESESDLSNSLDVKVVADGSEIMDMQELFQMAKKNHSVAATQLTAMERICSRDRQDRQEMEKKLVAAEEQCVSLETELEKAKNELNEKNNELDEKNNEFMEKTNELMQKHNELNEKLNELNEKHNELIEKNNELDEKKNELNECEGRRIHWIGECKNAMDKRDKAVDKWGKVAE
jgi:chromosome segregation ATPase